jgi:hypothetical protein
MVEKYSIGGTVAKGDIPLVSIPGRDGRDGLDGRVGLGGLVG